MRERPHWISSKIRTALTSSQRLRRAVRNSGVATLTPPSPWIGSTMTPQVFSVMRVWSCSTSLYVPYLKPGTMGEKGVWYFGFGVAERAPIVRPWKEWWKETNSCFAPEGSSDRPTFRANLIAASFASVPELEMNT